MKKFLVCICLFAVMLAAVFLPACSCGVESSTKSKRRQTPTMKDIPFVTDFTFGYYTADGKTKLTDVSASFAHDAEILVKVNFTLLSAALEKGLEKFTIRLLPSEGYSGRVRIANTSDTSDDKLTATFKVGDKDKQCSFEAKITFNYHGGFMLIGYVYDDDFGTNAFYEGGIVTDGFEIVTYTSGVEYLMPLNCSEPLNFTYNEATCGYSVGAYSNKNEWIKKLVVPDEFNEKPVNAIASYAFSGVETLTEITIPIGIKSVGERAFYGCSRLERVIFNGTKDEWIKISSAAGSESDEGSVTVKCADGDLKFKFN